MFPKGNLCITKPTYCACCSCIYATLQVVYEWACGTSFAEICQLTEVMEGAIVRTVMRLDETCREFRDAARIMGNTQLLEQVRRSIDGSDDNTTHHTRFNTCFQPSTDGRRVQRDQT